MATMLKQSTAETIEFGPFVDKTDGDTEETALSLVAADILISKNHAALTAKNDVTNPTGGTNGHYQVTLNTTDTGTLGRLRVYCHKTGALSVWEDFEVVPANVYDSLVAGTDTLQADLTQMGGAAQSATDLKDFADAGYDPATNKVQGLVLCDTLTTYTGNTVQTGDSYGRLGAPAGASVSADVAAVKTDTAAVLVDTGTTLDTKLNDIQGGTFSSATDSLEAIRDRGDAAWTTGAGGSDRLLMVDTTIATLASQTSFTLTAGSADDNAYNNCTIVIEDAATATQKAVGLISDYVGATKTVTLKYDPAIYTMAATDKVYILAENALKAGTANTQITLSATGAASIDWGKVENATSINDLTNTTVATVSTLTGHTAQTGDNYARIGAPAGASVSADVAAVKVDTAATLMDTAQIGVAGAGLTNINLPNQTMDITGNLSGSIGSLGTTAKADVNAEVVDVLKTDTVAQLSQAAPPATPTLEEAVMYLYQYFRNKREQTATTVSMYDDAGTTVIAKSTISDDATTFTKGEFATGP